MVDTKIRLIIFFAAKDAEALYSQGADCGSDHELLIAKFRLQLKKERNIIFEFCILCVSIESTKTRLDMTETQVMSSLLQNSGLS